MSRPRGARKEPQQLRLGTSIRASVWRRVRQGGRRDPSPSTLFLPVIAAAVFMVVLTDNVVNIILPMLASAFHATVPHVSWTITGYALVLAVGVPLYGRISDDWGVRRVFALSLPLFAFGSLVCALAPNLALLIAGRILQGAGAAGIPAIATVAVAKLLPPGRRGAAFGVIASTVGAGAAAGPIVGGVLTQYLGWRALFLGLMVLALLFHLAAQRVLPRQAGSGHRSFDLAGGLLVGLAAGLLLLGLTNLQSYGAAATATRASFAGALLAAGGFGWRIHAATDPFVPPALFRNRTYLVAVLTAYLTMTAYLALLVFVPLLLVDGGGLGSARAGLILSPGALAMALVSPRAGRLSDRIGPKPLIVTGLALLAAAALLLSTLGSGHALLVAGAAILAADLGLALLNAPTTNAVAAALPGAEAGAGLGIYRATFFLGAGSGPAALGALLAARTAAHAAAANPLYHLLDPAYSDTFLAAAVIALAGLAVAASGLRGQRRHRPAPSARTPMPATARAQRPASGPSPAERRIAPPSHPPKRHPAKAFRPGEPIGLPDATPIAGLPAAKARGACTEET